METIGIIIAVCSLLISSIAVVGTHIAVKRPINGEMKKVAQLAEQCKYFQDHARELGKGNTGVKLTPVPNRT